MEGKGYITQQQFIKKFWSAYTYDDVFQGEEAASSGKNCSGGVKGGSLSEKMKRCRMFNAIQKKVKLSHSVQQAFQKLDTGIGFLTLKDFQQGLS